MRAILPENRTCGATTAEKSGSHAHCRLTKEIVALSVAGRWQVAKNEWTLESIWLEPGGTCLCGHSITEHCLIRNRENGNAAVVGNYCVTKFMDLPAGRIFMSLRRVKRDTTAALNAETVEYAHGKGWLSDRERDFYLDTFRKPRNRLFPKQLKYRVDLNERVLDRATWHVPDPERGRHHA